MRRSLMPLVLLLAPVAMAAQIPNSSSRALGLGGAYTVSAQGFEAAAWNPSALGMRHNPGFTLGLPMAELEFGSTSFGFSDFRKYADKTLTQQDKNDILAKIDTSLGLRTIVGATPFGISISHFALTVSAAAGVEGALGKDAVDLALNGNASRSGPGQFFTARGSNGNGWAATTASLSAGFPLVSTRLGRISVGGTFKKVWGVGFGRGNETASHFQVNPTFQANGAGQAIYTDYSGNTRSLNDAPGSGIGVDVGGMLELPGGITVGATLVNVVNSMTWKSDRLRYERVDYTVTQTAGGQVTDTHTQTTLIGAQIDGDPVAKAFRDSTLKDAHFARQARVGATMHLGKLLLAADGQLRLSDGFDHPPSQSVAVGAEYVLLGILPLRAGFGTDFSKSTTLSAGTGIHLGPVHLDIGAANITGNVNPGVRVGAGLSLIF